MPEAVVHLYAPALGIGLATALAMVPQLTIDAWVDGGFAGVTQGLWIACALSIRLAVCARVVAPRLYRMGMFEAVPYLAEAIKTLAGPAIPEPTPWWIARIADPVLRMQVLGFWRGTPVPSLRLLILALATALGALVAEPTAAHATLVLTSSLVWLLPARSSTRETRARLSFLATLPLPAAQRRRAHPLAIAALCAPPLAAALPLCLRFLGLW